MEEKLKAPELRVTDWVNSAPLTMIDLRGRVVLVDFWDATCINCIHTLPYLSEWHHRYAEAGLTIIGIHAPEFEFSRDPSVVQGALQRFGLDYPVALDNDFRTWNAFANRAWPAKYLIDQQGYIRAFQRGEGAYQAFERKIQSLLHEMDPTLPFPEPLPPVRTIDDPGAVCHRSTPELYLGYGRGKLENPEGQPPRQAIDYAPPSHAQAPDTVMMEGKWLNQKEYVESASDSPACIHLNYRAAGVNLVMGVMGAENDNPVTGAEDKKLAIVAKGRNPVAVSLFLEGKPLPQEYWGEDVTLSEGQPVIVVEGPRMYALIRHPDFAEHQLTLALSAPGLRAYAFTFTTCVVEEEERTK